MRALKLAKRNIDMIAANKSVVFTLQQGIRVLSRRIPLPYVIQWRMSLFGTSEKNLTPYMHPIHGKVCLDVGAAIGLWTEKLLDRGYTVEAFEPDPRQLLVLRKLDKNPNLHIHSIAIGDENKYMKLHIARLGGHNSIVRITNDYLHHDITVQVRTIDSYNWHDVGLIKIDTEGFEIPVLKGAEQTILRCKPRLVIEVHEMKSGYVKEKTEILKLISKWGYSHKVFYRRDVQPHLVCDPNKKYMNEIMEEDLVKYG